jgi:hypothetical protein
MTPKFRAWHKKEKKMYDLTRISFIDNQVGLLTKNGTRRVWADEVVLMQSTGLKDQNGREIFEGDIIVGRLNQKTVVVWDNMRAMFTTEPKWKDGLSMYTEVIGNIYENSELLKEAKV